MPKPAHEKAEEFERQKDTLGNLASLGILTVAFGHETLGSVNVVVTNAKQLRLNMDRGLFMVTPDVFEVIQDNLSMIVLDAERIETFAAFTLKNVSRDKRTRKSVYLNEVVEKVFAAFENSLADQGISVDMSNVPKKISPILGFQIDWESVLINLLTNSIWALKDTKAGSQRIRTSVRESADYVDVLFADSGRGLEADSEKKIFLPTFTTKRNKKGELIGTGMGLTIVQSFVEAYDGTIQVMSPCDLGGASFHIRVPILRKSGPNETKEA